MRSRGMNGPSSTNPILDAVVRSMQKRSIAKAIQHSRGMLLKILGLIFLACLTQISTQAGEYGDITFLVASDLHYGA